MNEPSPLEASPSLEEARAALDALDEDGTLEERADRLLAAQAALAALLDRGQA